MLNYLLIPSMGYLVAGYTTMISYMLMAFLHYTFLNNIVRENPEIKEVFEVKFLFISSLCLIAAGFGMYFIYDYP